MEQLLMLCLLILSVDGSLPIYKDLEKPSALAWLHIDWTQNDTLPQKEIISVVNKECICRLQSQSIVVCYGGKRCSKFPKRVDLPPEITDLRVKTTAIQRVARTDLENFSTLTDLVIDANNHLQIIEELTFSNMKNLKNLSISYNSELKYLLPDIFFGLENLEVLLLVRNGFENIFDVSNALQDHYLPKLLSLSLNENSFPNISEDSFSLLNGTNLNELELILCQIQEMAPRSLNVFRNLTTLRLGDNLLSERDLGLLLENLVKEEISIKLLNLFNLGFRRGEKLKNLLSIISDLNVTHLILARNHLESISNDLFPPMPSLEFLDLREVSAVNIDAKAFSEQLFPNLQILLLAGNKLSGISPGVLHKNLLVLDLSENSGGPLSPSYFDVTTTDINETLKLQSLDLSYDRVSTITKNTFRNFAQLKILGLKNATIFYISKKAFSHLKFLEVLNLENNSLKPFNEFNSSIFDGLVNLQRLFLGNCKIVSFRNSSIFKSLVNLKYLDLRDNELMRVDPEVMLPLFSLVGIDLSENNIQPWTTSLFHGQQDLQVIILSSNRLSTITAAMMEDFENLTRIDVSQNAFFCDCWALNQTMKWLQTRDLWANQTPIANPNHVCTGPENWKNKQIVSFLDSPDKCMLAPFFSAPVYVFMATVIIFCIGLGVLVYMYRWHIRYWIFLARMAFLRRHGWLLKKNKVHPGDYNYDVFVSYSHEDRNFIVRMVAMLENQAPFLKLCVYERDFEIGTEISATVMEKVTQSRRTLLVVSNSFAKSQWCLWEMQLAESHRLFFRNSQDCLINDPLVIIKLGPIAQSNMTPTLKFLLKSRIYLEWNHEPKKEVVFWEKLRATLTPTKISLSNKVGAPNSTVLLA